MNVKEEAKIIHASIQASSYYIELAKKFYDETYDEALMMTAARSKRKLDNQRSFQRTGFIWYVLYDVISAHGHEQLKNDALIAVILHLLAQKENVKKEFLEKVLKAISQGTTPYNSFFSIYYQVDEEGERVSESEENQDVLDGLKLISNKFLQESLLGQMLTTKSV